MAGKLNPPIIEGNLPAIYERDGDYIISVPFSINRAVGLNQIKGIAIKIKTVQTNTAVNVEIGDRITDASEIQEVLQNLVAIFSIQTSGINLEIGQYIKIQIAFIDSNNTVGYYSTVGVAKLTAIPELSISASNATDLLHIDTFFTEFVGKFSTQDSSEVPYSYIFEIYDNQMNNLICSSGWQLHNNNGPIDKEDSYTNFYDYHIFNQYLRNMYYKIRFGVKTINNLEVYSDFVSIHQNQQGFDLQTWELKAENNYDNGFVRIYLADYNNGEEARRYRLLRADKDHSYDNWIVVDNFTVYTTNDLDNWEFIDFTVEHGITYKYQLQYYTNWAYSFPVESNVISVDFEDMFLSDGVKQLKLRFNPKVSSFKTTIQEQKIDTIGGKFPVFYRNGQVAYKDFPISCLLSYYSDNDEYFATWQELGLINQFLTTDLVDYNILAERRFKTKAMEWLQNGKPKLFRSPTEGNYIVRLMNISLTPEDRLGRMLHTMSCQAYEVQEYNDSNLRVMGFYNTNAETTRTITIVRRGETWDKNTQYQIHYELRNTYNIRIKEIKSLRFNRKTPIILYYYDNKYYTDSAHTIEYNDFDSCLLYHILGSDSMRFQTSDQTNFRTSDGGQFYTASTTTDYYACLKNGELINIDPNEDLEYKVDIMLKTGDYAPTINVTSGIQILPSLATINEIELYNGVECNITFVGELMG